MANVIHLRHEQPFQGKQTVCGGGVLQKIRMGMLKVEFKISTISIPRKAWFCDPSLYHFSAKKHPIWGKLGALAKFSKIHPILQIERIGYVTITHQSIYQNLRKCTSKPLSIPVYHLSVRTPPPDCVLIFIGHSVLLPWIPNLNFAIPKTWSCFQLEWELFEPIFLQKNGYNFYSFQKHFLEIPIFESSYVNLPVEK